MPDTEKPAEAAAPAVPPKRHPGHRGQDVRDTVAEMAAKAHEISLEAGSKMAAAMKDVVGAPPVWSPSPSKAPAISCSIWCVVVR